MDKTKNTPDMIKKYQIGGKTYIQKKLVLGQIRQLVNHLDGLSFPADASLTLIDILKLMGDKLPIALAICLTEEGKSPRDKDIAALSAELEFIMDAELTMTVVNDFFLLNQIYYLLESLSGITSRFRKTMTG